MRFFINSFFVFILLFCFSSQAQDNWEEFKALARENLAKSGNLRIRSEQMNTYQNFDTPKWRTMLDQGGGKPVLSVKTDYVEELSLKKNMFILGWEQTRKFAQSVSDLDKKGYGNPFINTMKAIEYITSKNILLKSDQGNPKGTHYWNYDKNETQQLILDSSLDNVCKLLFGDLFRNGYDLMFLRSVSGSEEENAQVLLSRNESKNYVIDIFYAGRKYRTREFMAEHPEKLLSEVVYKGNNKVFAFTKVDYEELKPISIVTYQFYGDPIDLTQINDSEFMKKHCNSINETKILEYTIGIADDVFQLDFEESLKDGDVVTDQVSGYYEIIGEEGSRRRLDSIR